MTLRGWRIVVPYLVAGAVLAGGIVQVVDRRAGHDEPAAVHLDQLGELAVMPFATTLASTGPAETRVGSTLAVEVGAFSARPIERVVLYDGAVPIAAARPDEADHRVSLVYPALSVGAKVLHAEIEDVDGAVAFTAPVAVTVAVGAAASGGHVALRVDALAGESTADVAARLGLDAEAVAAYDPGAVSPDGDPASAPVPVPAQAVLPAGAVVTVVVAPDRGLDQAVDLRAPSAVAAAIAGAPSVTLDPDGCAVSSDDGATLVELGAGAPGWRVLSSDDQALSPGRHVVRAQRDGHLSPPVAVDVAQHCGSGLGWSGDLAIVDGTLRSALTGPGFVVVSVDDGLWQRIPPTQRELLAFRPDLDISHLLPAVAGSRVEVQAWRSGDVPTLLATGSLTVPTGMTAAQILGEPSALTLQPTAPNARNDDAYVYDGKPVSFDWSSASPRVERVRWQVTTTPQSSLEVDPNPPGLLATGTTEVGRRVRGTAHGRFTVDPKLIPTAPAGPTASGGAPPSAPPSSPSPLAGTVQALGASPLTDATAATARLQPIYATALDPETHHRVVALPEPGTEVYVRVITEPNASGPAAASTSVPITLPRAEGPGDLTDVEVKALTLDVGRAPNLALVGCVDVRVPWPDPRTAPSDAATPRLPWWKPAPDAPNELQAAFAATGSPFQASVVAAFYPVDGTYCPGDWPPPTKCSSLLCDLYYGVKDAVTALWDLVSTYWDLAASLYNTVVDGIVDTVAQMNLACAIFGAAGAQSTEAACYQVTRTVVGTAADIGLTALGLPPQIPSSTVLTDLSEGQLDALLVEAMKAVGVPCDVLATDPALVGNVLALVAELGVEVDGTGVDGTAVAEAIAQDPCRALAGAIRAAVAEQLATSSSASVAAASGMPGAMPLKGLVITPSPLGVPQPARVFLQVEPARANADTTGLVCQVAIHRPGSPTSSWPQLYRWQTMFLNPAAPTRSFVAATSLVPYDVDRTLETFAAGGVVALAVSPRHPTTRCDFPTAIVSDQFDPALPRPTR